ncbi:MAG: hypothetical protein KDB32_09935 [Planctomycetes bacterium]|nr:hypothetical protein [Planctomycetota bacterium]
MKYAAPILILMMLAACGGASGDQTGNAVYDADTAAEPDEKALREQSRLENLKRLAREATEKFPGIENYDRVLQEAKGEVDGAREFIEAAARAEKLWIGHGDEPWRHLLNYGSENFEDEFNRKATREDYVEALKQSAQLARDVRDLSRCDSLVAIGPMLLDPDSAKYLGGIWLQSLPIQRVELLLELDMTDLAKEELVYNLRMRRLLDVTTLDFALLIQLVSTESLFRGFFRSEKLAVLAKEASVQEAVDNLRMDAFTMFKRAWRSEFSHVVKHVLEMETLDNDWSRDPYTDALGQYEYLEFMLKAAEAFPDRAPDPFNADDYARTKKLAGESGGRDLEEAIIHRFARMRGHQCAWLAWDMFVADQDEPLLNRKLEAETMIANVPFATATWTDSELEIRLDPDAAVLRDTREPAMNLWFWKFRLQQPKD